MTPPSDPGAGLAETLADFLCHESISRGLHGSFVFVAGRRHCIGHLDLAAALLAGPLAHVYADAAETVREGGCRCNCGDESAAETVNDAQGLGPIPIADMVGIFANPTLEGHDDLPPEWTDGCGCLTCTSARVASPSAPWSMPFIVCPDCRNKRCPRATDHRRVCTGSNEPGQEGSRY